LRTPTEDADHPKPAGPGFTEAPWPPIRNLVVSALKLHRPHTFHGFGQADVTEAKAAIRRLTRQRGEGVSLHAWVAHCLAEAACRHPEVLTFRHGKRLVTFHDADIATTIARRLPDGSTVAGAYTLRAAQTKSVLDLNAELRAAVKTPLSEDEGGRLRRRLAERSWVTRAWIGRRMQRDPHMLRAYFGTIGLTNLQVPAFSSVYYALPPNFYTMTIAIGPVSPGLRLTPDGATERRHMLSVAMAVDHALLDGVPAARFGRTLGNLLESAYGLTEGAPAAADDA